MNEQGSSRLAVLAYGGTCLPSARSADSFSATSWALMCTGAITCVVSDVTEAWTTPPSCMTRGSSTLACALSQNTCSHNGMHGRCVTGGHRQTSTSKVTAVEHISEGKAHSSCVFEKQFRKLGRAWPAVCISAAALGW